MLGKSEQFEKKNQLVFYLKKIQKFSILPLSFPQIELWIFLNLLESKINCKKLQFFETKQCISENYIQQGQVFYSKIDLTLKKNYL